MNQQYYHTCEAAKELIFFEITNSTTFQLLKSLFFNVTTFSGNPAVKIDKKHSNREIKNCQNKREN